MPLGLPLVSIPFSPGLVGTVVFSRSPWRRGPVGPSLSILHLSLAPSPSYLAFAGSSHQSSCDPGETILSVLSQEEVEDRRADSPPPSEKIPAQKQLAPGLHGAPQQEASAAGPPSPARFNQDPKTCFCWLGGQRLTRQSAALCWMSWEILGLAVTWASRTRLCPLGNAGVTWLGGDRLSPPVGRERDVNRQVHVTAGMSTGAVCWDHCGWCRRGRR